MFENFVLLTIAYKDGGAESLRELTEDFGPLPKAPSIDQSGSISFFYAAPEPTFLNRPDGSEYVGFEVEIAPGISIEESYENAIFKLRDPYHPSARCTNAFPAIPDAWWKAMVDIWTEDIVEYENSPDYVPFQ